MNFSLIICTYNRRNAIETLMNSIVVQLLYPNQIIIVDGSLNLETKAYFESANFKNLDYFLVDDINRGLTKQRNFGISKVNSTTEIVCFLDDDTILDEKYFEEIINTYARFPDAFGVGGYITNEVKWEKNTLDFKEDKKYFTYDGFHRSEDKRFILRKSLGLDSDVLPGFSPLFSHGRSVSYLPTSGKIYKVEQLMGGVSSFKKEVLDIHKFSTYFEGYGLYEDAEFTIRISKFGQLYLNTNAQLEHHHDASGRPNKYNYGKMVVRNGWYVWRTKNPNPKMIHSFKWHSITILLTLIRVANILTTNKRKEALTESLGRTVGWFSLLTNKPLIID
ncbi:glycosyltransferase family 2 protein [Flavobacterium urocaniciphilum]|uniref:Glycosyltransferase, GT2 family n=1 Tax=Flavobacterium urocaniciphilum TaxID=1299341 RepID=A0A1H8YS38_9FLAO|nr:glycosyltransferase family A protein [Flavobacterium urocaniciphilum]SEP54939.1 Glycosyltransferase, GT2 family [Flavobacterium urocaniciphilum]